MSLSTLVLVSFCAHLAAVPPRPMSLQERLKQSLGKKYIDANAHAAQGRSKRAQRIYESLILKWGKSPAATASQRRLAILTKGQKRYARVDLNVQLTRTLKKHKTHQRRHFRLVISTQKPFQRDWKMQAGSSLLSFHLKSSSSRGLELFGYLQVESKPAGNPTSSKGASAKMRFRFSPIVYTPAMHKRMTREWRMHGTKAAITLKVTDAASPEPMPPVRSSGVPGSHSNTHSTTTIQKTMRTRREFHFKLAFRNASAQKIVHRIARLLDLKAKWKGPASQTTHKMVRLKGHARNQLIAQVCKSLRLRCRVVGDVWEISARPTPPTPPKAPTPPPSQHPAVPTPPTPPTPPQR